MDVLPIYSKENDLIRICKSFVGQSVKITASFMGSSILIINTNTVGDILQSIFLPIFKEELGFVEGLPQQFPDYYGDNTKDFYFEQKVYTNSPGFDLANFASYIDQLCKDGAVFDKLFRTKYLIWEYSINGFEIIIKNFHYLNIWNIPSYTGVHPISLQVKRGMWYNIRPGAVSGWTDQSKTPGLFIKHIIECINVCDQIRDKNEKIEKINKQWFDLSEKYRL